MTPQPAEHLTGIVIEVKGNPFPHSFWIKGEDHHIYFSRLGDIKKNNDLILNKKQRTEYLEKNDKVTFIPYNKIASDAHEESHALRAIHVEKIKP